MSYLLIALIASLQSAAAPVQGPAGAYQLGPGDHIVVRVTDVEQFDGRQVLVDNNGCISLPMAGRIAVAGLSSAQVESEITQRLKTYFKKPDVSVTVTEFRSQPVSIFGAVRNPGVHQVQGRKTLIEALSLAGGLDAASGPSIKITRRVEMGRIPLPGAGDDPSGSYSVAEVRVKSLVDGSNPAANIGIMAHDVISVPKAETVYVIGMVNRAGGFPIGEQGDITVLQALSLAGGLQPTAKPQQTRILRRADGAEQRLELAVNLKRMLDGTIPDMALQSEDILFIPDNAPKKAALRAVEASVQMLTGIVIFRR